MHKTETRNEIVYPTAFLGTKLRGATPADVGIEYNGDMRGDFVVNTLNPSLVRIYAGGKENLLKEYTLDGYTGKTLGTLKIYSVIGYKWTKPQDNTTGEIKISDDTFTTLKSSLNREERFIYERAPRVNTYEKEEEGKVRELILTYKKGEELKADVDVTDGRTEYRFRIEELTKETMTSINTKPVKLDNTTFYVPVIRTSGSIVKTPEQTKTIHLNLQSLFTRFRLPVPETIKLLRFITKTNNLEARIVKR